MSETALAEQTIEARAQLAALEREKAALPALHAATVQRGDFDEGRAPWRSKHSES